MTISMDQRLSAPTTRVVGPIAIHLVGVGETFAVFLMQRDYERTYRLLLVIPGIANTCICTTSNISSAIP